ncbi:MAG: PAS domain S-box protein [Lentimicrobium sp.]
MAFGGLHKKQSDINNLFTLLKDSLAISEDVNGLVFTISNLLNDLVWICDKNKETVFGNKLFKETFLYKIRLEENSKYNISAIFGNKLDLFFLQKECLGQISIDVKDRKYLLSINSNSIECVKNEYFIFYAELNEVEDRSVYDQKEEYRALWELSNNCLRIVDENGFIIDVNQNFCNLVNKPINELIGNYYDSVYLTPHAKPINFLRKFNPRLESMVTLWNGEVYYFDIRSKIITYKSGQKAVVSIIRNITYMRETENRLFNVERQFNETAELIPQVFFEADKNGVITYCNSYAYKMFNVTESVNEKEFNILSFIAKESKEKAINNFNYRLNNKKITSNEYVVQTSIGQKIPVLIYSAPLIRNGEIEGLRGIIIDISEQKKLEETVRKSEYLYRTIVNTSPDGISLMDINGQIIFANDKKAELFGYKSGNDLVGVNAFNLVSKNICCRCKMPYSKTSELSSIERMKVIRIYLKKIVF